MSLPWSLWFYRYRVEQYCLLWSQWWEMFSQIIRRLSKIGDVYSQANHQCHIFHANYSWGMFDLQKTFMDPVHHWLTTMGPLKSLLDWHRRGTGNKKKNTGKICSTRQGYRDTDQSDLQDELLHTDKSVSQGRDKETLTNQFHRAGIKKHWQISFTRQG